MVMAVMAMVKAVMMPVMAMTTTMMMMMVVMAVVVVSTIFKLPLAINSGNS